MKTCVLADPYLLQIENRRICRYRLQMQSAAGNAARPEDKAQNAPRWSVLPDWTGILGFSEVIDDMPSAGAPEPWPARTGAEAGALLDEHSSV